MKKMMVILIVIAVMISCKSEREKQIEKINKESIEIISETTSKLLVSNEITQAQVDTIIRTYTKIASDSAELGYQYAIKVKHLANSSELYPQKSEKQTITFQEYFLEQKAELYNSDYLNATNDAAKMLFHKKTEKLTKQLLDSTNQTLTNWVGTISRISLAYGHNQRDMELLKTMSPNAVVEKYPEGRDINIYIIVGEKKLDKATYLAEVYQEFNPKKNERGIKPNSSLYETVLGLKEGQQVMFSAKVKRTMDTNGKNNEQFTGFNIELTEIKSEK